MKYSWQDDEMVKGASERLVAFYEDVERGCNRAVMVSSLVLVAWADVVRWLRGSSSIVARRDLVCGE